MRTRLLCAIATVLLTGLFGGAQKQADSSQIQKFSSPDGKIVAFVRSRKAPEATSESRVELRSQNGRVLARRNYGSEDGEHGYGATKAAWTPDSQFVVYSLESSGGHQAWHTPVQFFSRTEGRIISLDDALKDAVMNPQFVISTPDRVTVELFSKQTKTVSLHELQRVESLTKNGPKRCTTQEAMQAEESTDHLNDWNDNYDSFGRFSQCDDGGIAEGYSDAVSKLLADDWNQFPDLVRLAATDKHFQSFVLRHVDETIPAERLKKVAQNANSRCLAHAARLCRLIIEAALQ